MSTSLLPVSCFTIYFLAHGGQKAAAACWYSSLVQFEFFALGALTALVLRGRIPSWRVGTRLWLVMLGAALWMTAEGLFHVRWATEHSGPTSRFIGYQFVGIGCVSLLVAFLGIPSKYLPRPLVYLGKVSYGLYVFHYVWFELTTDTFTHILPTPHGTVGVAIQSLISIPIELLLTILTAAVSYRLLEKPFLKLKERFTTINSRAV